MTCEQTAAISLDRTHTDLETLAELQAAAGRAAARYEWERVIALTTQALALPEVPPETAYTLLEKRATGHRYTGNLLAEVADRQRMGALAAEMGDARREAMAIQREADAIGRIGDQVRARELFERARTLSQEACDPQACAQSMLAMALLLQFNLGDLRASQVQAERALRQFEELGDELGQARSLRAIVNVVSRTADAGAAKAIVPRILDLYRRAGDREGEASGLNALCMATANHAENRAYSEQALAIYEEIGYQPGQASQVNNLAVVYLKLGLYARATDYAERATSVARQMHSRNDEAYFLDTLARAHLSQGQLDLADRFFREGQATAWDTGASELAGAYSLGLGWVALASGRAEEARQLLVESVVQWGELGALGEQAISLAWLGSAHLALGDVSAAQDTTSQAIALVEAGNVTIEYAPQEIWWWRYQALSALLPPGLLAAEGEGGSAPRSPDVRAGRAGEPVALEGRELAWNALDRAREAMVTAVATLSDDGLRRNYFGKVAINRSIVETWLAEARRRSLPATPLIDHLSGPTSAEEQLKRMLDIGVRLNARREAAELPSLILDEVVELTGAARAAFVRVDEVGERRPVAACVLGKPVLVAGDGGEGDGLLWLAAASGLLNESVEKRTPILRHVPPGRPELEQTSLLCVPLLVQARLVGLVYCELDGHYGRFTRQDSDLLSVLANQAAVALENARWAQTLEKRVEERTAELRASTARLEERTAELEIINSIGQGLAEQLEFQAIVDLVGERIREIFNADATSIYLYDRKTNVVSCPYGVERGQRSKSEPFELGRGLTSAVIQRRLPLLVGTWEQASALGAVRVNIDPANLDETHTESYLGVPILAGGDVIGVVDVHSYRQFAFGEADVRLLSTIAANMGVALENSRLFEETSGLLDETRQRNAELALINAIQQGLAAQLDAQAIIDLVGDKLREIFGGQNTFIALYDKNTNMIGFPYWVADDGQRICAEPMELGVGLTSRVITSRQPLVLGTAEEGNALGWLFVEDGIPDNPESWLGVPILVGNDVTGVISLQDWPKNRYGESDVRLLSTLASSMAVSLENARLLDESQRRAEQMATVADVGREISAMLDMSSVLERIAARVHELFGAHDTVLRLVDPDGVTFRTLVALGQYAEQFTTDTVVMGSGISGDIARTGIAEVIEDTDRDPRSIHVAGTPDQEEEPFSLMCAPLISRGRTTGLLQLYRPRAAGVFTQADLRFLVALARQAGIAVENARLFEAAQESQRRMSDIIDFLPDATLVVDREGRVMAWNQAIEEMTGVKASEMLGKGDFEYALPFYAERRPILIDLVLLPDEDIEQRYAHIQRNGPILAGEALVPVLQGRPAYLYATASALRNARGEVVGAIETIRDISDRKHAEEELRQAKGAAEAANQSKSAFLAMMSHEIRTPMNAIIGMSGLLLDTHLDAEQRDFAETVRTSGDALLTIINDILDFSKIEAGKMEVEEQPFDLRECVEDSLDLVRLRAAEKGLELAYQVSSDVPAAILGDVTRLRQVLVNLLNNAVKFTDAGEVVLSAERVEAAGAEGAGRQPDYLLLFSVRDTGIGIPPDRIGRLFQAFTQVDASTTRRFGGTGLGLAVSKRLVEMMGGALWVESTGVPGQGSTFHFTVRTQTAPAVRARPHLGREHPQLHGKRLLIVDDNATNRRILVLQTRGWGMVPRDTASAHEAIEWIRQGDPFDAGILDLQMPELDGIALAAEIRRHRDAQALPLVLSSSLGAREAGTPMGEFVAYLVKPIRPSVLFDMLMGIFGAEPVGPVPAARTRPGVDAEMARRHPLRILVAEDNAVNQKLALRLLARMGYRADVAGNGLEAIQALVRQHYDVILMDVQMPEMDGLEATRHISARWPRGQRPHIIAMTANVMEGDRQLCLDAGMDDYVGKPIRVDELVSALQAVSPRPDTSST